jgi:hypothetical protein
MHDAAVIERMQMKYHTMAPVLDERARRLWAATEARELGWGGVSCLAAATGLSRTTIAAGLRELRMQTKDQSPNPKIRRPGGGRKHLLDSDLGLWERWMRSWNP